LRLDIFDRRLRALNEVLDAANARVAESAAVTHENVHLHMGAAPVITELRRFWQARRSARPLFGEEVDQAVQRLEERLRAYDTIRINTASRIRSGSRDWQPVIDEETEVQVALDAVADAARAYVTIGRMGLTWRARLQLWTKAA
jgi:ADP-ribosylglycohydrolase